MKINKKIILGILIAAVLTAAICYLFLFKKSNIIIQQESTANISSIISQKNYIQLMFVGDIMLDRGIRYYAQKNGSNEFIFDKISPLLLNNDLVVANLEGPITNNKSISAGTVAGSPNNYYFTFDPGWAKTLYENNIKIVNLGNNHILNFGRAGLESTKEYLDQAGVGYFGSPMGPRSISKEIEGIKVTFVSYNEFSSLSSEAEEKSVIEEIEKSKGFSDIIMVFSHWGTEYSLVPNESDVNLAHKLINAGADFIIGAHPHVIQIVEKYNGKMIYYSLGNFIFDQYFNEDVRNSLGVIVQIDKATKKIDFSERYFYLQSGGQTIEKTPEK